MSDNKTYQFSEETMATAQRIIRRYPEGKHKSALIPLLHLAQAEFDGWLSSDVMDYVASILEIKPIEVYEVVSFYTMYNQRPIGKYMFEFCQTSPCCLNGVEDLMDYTCEKLGVGIGETTPDGLFEVRGVECLGACGYAPMMQLGDFYKEHLTKEKVDQIIADCRANKITLHDK